MSTRSPLILLFFLSILILNHLFLSLSAAEARVRTSESQLWVPTPMLRKLFLQIYICVYACYGVECVLVSRWAGEGLKTRAAVLEDSYIRGER